MTPLDDTSAGVAGARAARGVPTPEDRMRSRQPSTSSEPGPGNRAQRRAAARGKDTPPESGGPAAPRTSGPGVRVRPVHTRVDFAARKSG